MSSYMYKKDAYQNINLYFETIPFYDLWTEVNKLVNLFNLLTFNLDRKTNINMLFTLYDLNISHWVTLAFVVNIYLKIAQPQTYVLHMLKMHIFGIKIKSYMLSDAA